MDLDQQIKARRNEVRTDNYPVSIGELISLYESGDLDIHPEFQRFYRWTDHQKSRLIESILLGIPIPSIFVSQREDGIWDVIDGLQRLSTIFQLVGVLRDDIDSPISPLVLKSTKYLPALEGKKWEDEGTDLGIGEVNQRLIRRAKLDVQIILRESSDSTKYELFQRLNTGGTQLSDQELRNAILVMINSAAYEWLQDLAEDSNFNQCTPLSERALERQDNLELVTRFLVLRRLEEDKLKWTGDFNDFLTEHISSIAQNRDFEMIRESERRAFRTTFELLSHSLGEDVFRKYDENKDRHYGPVMMSAFELIAMGLGYNFEEYESGRSLDLAGENCRVGPFYMEQSPILGEKRIRSRGVDENQGEFTSWKDHVRTMMIRSLNHLTEYLDVEMSWRKKELTTLRYRLARCRDHERGILTKASLCLLYAHWEGFVRVAATCYVDYVVRQGIHLRDLAPNFIALGLRSEIRKAGESKKSTKHTKLVKKLRSDLSESFGTNAGDAIQISSNLKVKVLEEILSVTGIDPTDYLGKRVIIDRLVDQRNIVAHGVHGEGYDILQCDYEALHRDVIALVEMFRTDIENAAAQKSYLKSVSGTT